MDCRGDLGGECEGGDYRPESDPDSLEDVANCSMIVCHVKYNNTFFSRLEGRRSGQRIQLKSGNHRLNILE